MAKSVVLYNRLLLTFLETALLVIAATCVFVNRMITPKRKNESAHLTTQMGKRGCLVSTSHLKKLSCTHKSLKE